MAAMDRKHRLAIPGNGVALNPDLILHHHLERLTGRTVGSQHPVVATGDLRFERVHDGFLNFLFLRCEAMFRRCCLFRLFGSFLRHRRFALFTRYPLLCLIDSSLPDELFGKKTDQPRIYAVNNEL